MSILCSRCGREYDATLFAFGRAIRCDCGAVVHLARGHVGRLEAAPLNGGVPMKACYHCGHTWARKEKPGHVLCGLDGFAASLLAELTGVILPTEGSPLRQGRIGWWIAAGPEVVPLRAPISGRVRRRNHSV